MGGCKECNKLRQRKDRTQDSRLRRFCIHGHDTLVCGRYKDSRCKECSKAITKKRHKKTYVPHPNPFKQFCPKGHDKDIVGRTPHGNCSPCAKTASTDWHNTEKGKLTAKQWYIDNVQVDSPENKIRREKYSRIVKMRHWKERGVKNFDGTIFTAEDYNIVFEKQNGKCAICGRHQSELKTALAADHDHVTGFFRGLLCLSCNVLLGKHEKNKEKLERYLNLHERDKQHYGPE